MDPRCRTAPAASHRVNVRLQHIQTCSCVFQLRTRFLPTEQTFGRCTFWRCWAGSLETPGTEGRTHKPAVDTKRAAQTSIKEQEEPDTVQRRGTTSGFLEISSLRCCQRENYEVLEPKSSSGSPFGCHDWKIVQLFPGHVVRTWCSPCTLSCQTLTVELQFCFRQNLSLMTKCYLHERDCIDISNPQRFK